ERTASLQSEIAERKEAEEALRSSEARIRLIVNTAFDAMITCDARGNIVEWNTQAEKIFGWSCQEVAGRNLTETLIPARYREAHRRGMERFVATGEGPILNKRVELVAIDKAGREL